MNKILIILESPGKIKKVEQILGNNYKAIASFGHVMDLNPKTMSIEIENNFNPIYIFNPTNDKNKQKVINDIKNWAKKVDDVYLASDPDREGENIAWSVAKLLNIKNPKRITYTSITKKDLLDAIKNPRNIDQNLLNAQKARRILDRIVGYELSGLLKKHIGQSHSAGRVQSVVARLIVDRENEIKKFMGEPFKSFFKFKAEFNYDGKTFNANLYQMNNIDSKNEKDFYKGGICKIENEEPSKKFLDNCIKSIFKVENIVNKKRTQGPSPPFTTSTLQQEANRKFGFTGKRTMTCAQRLYEGGYITYMRTDSVNLSEESLQNIKKFVIDTYGENYHRSVEYKSKSKNTQEAHEAIRPSDVFTTDVKIDDKIGPDEAKLYSLIWKRTVASQMKPAEYDTTSIQISISEEKNHFFATNLEKMTFPGFLLVYNINNIIEENEDSEDVNNSNKDINIPEQGTILEANSISCNQEYVKPVGRYTYASLTEKLDPKNLNIGRPATYVSIIDKILQQNYVKIGDSEGVNVDCKTLIWYKDTNKINENKSIVVLGKEKSKYMPTPLGIVITYFLMVNFPKIMDYKFTADMEDKLDDIANNKLVWYKVLQEFYDDFHATVEKLKGENIHNAKLLGKHPVSGFNIYAMVGKYSSYVKMIDNNGKKVNTSSIPENITLENIKLNDAVKLLEYPKVLGKYNNKDIILHNSKDGLYVSCGILKCNIDNENISLDSIIETFKEKQKRTFESDKKIYKICNGPYGAYINIYDTKTKKSYNCGGVPSDEDLSIITLERILEIVNNYNNYKQSVKKVKNVKTVKTVKKSNKLKNIKITK